MKAEIEKEIQDDIREVGMNIKLLRTEKRLIQPQLADKAGITTNQICLVEKGKTNPTLKMLMKISKALDVELIRLIDRG